MQGIYADIEICIRPVHVLTWYSVQSLNEINYSFEIAQTPTGRRTISTKNQEWLTL